MIVALIPAAGESRRMGRPKLLLPLGGRPLLDHVLQAFQDGGVDRLIVVSPPFGRPETAEILALADRRGATAVIPDEQPPQMRESVEFGLSTLDPDDEAVLLAPGDSPSIHPRLVRRLIEAFRADPASIHIPTHQGKRGHPIVLPRLLADAIPGLPRDVGINFLIARESARVREWPDDEIPVADDLDTPEDYERWLHDPRFGPNPR